MPCVVCPCKAVGVLPRSVLCVVPSVLFLPYSPPPFLSMLQEVIELDRARGGEDRCAIRLPLNSSFQFVPRCIFSVAIPRYRYGLQRQMAQLRQIPYPSNSFLF